MIIPIQGNTPVRKHGDDAGADLVLAEDVYIAPGKIELADLGTRLAIPVHPDCHNKAYAGLIMPRSGLGSKGITLANSVGLIDASFRGSLKVALINHSGDEVRLFEGERVAQLVIIEVLLPEFQTVDHFNVDTTRGEGGFGSTGVN